MPSLGKMFLVIEYIRTFSPLLSKKFLVLDLLNVCPEMFAIQMWKELCFLDLDKKV